MTEAIRVEGLVKTFGPVRALERARPGGRPPGRCTASSARTAPGRPPPSGSCSACCGPTPAPPGCSAATRGATPPQLHRRLAYVPGDVTLWPNLSGGEVIDLLGRLRGGLDTEAPRRAAGALRPRPDQEGPHLLQGQPAEGGAGRRARLRRRAAAARRADLGPGPADGGGRSGRCIGEDSATAAAPCCCPATSWPRSRRSATGSPSSAPAGRWRPARSPSCGT